MLTYPEDLDSNNSYSHGSLTNVLSEQNEFVFVSIENVLFLINEYTNSLPFGDDLNKFIFAYVYILSLSFNFNDKSFVYIILYSLS